MSELSFNSKLLKAILENDRTREMRKEIIENKISIPFDLLKLGYNYSVWRQGGTTLSDKNAEWLHVAAFCEDPRIEPFIEDAFFSEVRFKGDCLLAMWVKNPKKAIYWLDLIHEYDPLFNTLKFHDTKMVNDLISNFKCSKNELFSRIYLSDEERKTTKISESVQKVLSTETRIKEQFGKIETHNYKKFDSVLRETQEQRDLLISSNSITAEQADLIFNALWESNISFSNPESDFVQRTPEKVFVGYRDEDSGWGFKYSIEARQLLKLLPMLSKNSLQKIEKLYNYLPFWMNLYRPVEKALFKFKPEKVQNDWKILLKTDLQIGGKRNSWAVGGGNERTQPTIDDLLYGLERIRPLKDKDLLISLINHYDGKVREKVQELLKESIK